MSGFIDRIFGTKVEVDMVRAELESRLCFESSQLDKELLRLYVIKERATEITKFLRDVLAVSRDKTIAVAEEISFLQAYIDLVKGIKEEDFYIQFNAKAEEISHRVEPFILFPLIQNAVKNGYSSMEKYPIKIRVSVSEGGILLEVSNRVNHYIENQAEDEIIRLYKQRLLVSYPDKHELFLNSNSNTFKATLFLKY